IEADQPIPAGDASAYLVWRILATLQGFELAMDSAHELVEMQASLANDGHRLEEAIHQEALAPADSAVHPDAARHIRARDHPAQATTAPRPELDELVEHSLEPRNGGELRGIGPVAPRREDTFVLLLNVQCRSRSPCRRCSRLPASDPGAGPAPPLRRARPGRGFTSPYMLRARLSLARAASRTTSDIDGCGWQTRPISSAAALNSIATAASAIRSLALWAMMCTPRISSVFASASNLTKPSGWPMPSARPLAANGNCPAW